LEKFWFPLKSGTIGNKHTRKKGGVVGNRPQKKSQKGGGGGGGKNKKKKGKKTKKPRKPGGVFQTTRTKKCNGEKLKTLGTKQGGGAKPKRPPDQTGGVWLGEIWKKKKKQVIWESRPCFFLGKNSQKGANSMGNLFPTPPQPPNQKKLKKTPKKTGGGARGGGGEKKKIKKKKKRKKGKCKKLLKGG